MTPKCSFLLSIKMILVELYITTYNSMNVFVNWSKVDTIKQIFIQSVKNGLHLKRYPPINKNIFS